MLRVARGAAAPVVLASVLVLVRLHDLVFRLGSLGKYFEALLIHYLLTLHRNLCQLR